MSAGRCKNVAGTGAINEHDLQNENNGLIKVRSVCWLGAIVVVLGLVSADVQKDWVQLMQFQKSCQHTHDATHTGNVRGRQPALRCIVLVARSPSLAAR